MMIALYIYKDTKIFIRIMNKHLYRIENGEGTP